MDGLCPYALLRMAHYWMLLVDFLLKWLLGHSILYGSQEERSMAAAAGRRIHVRHVLARARPTAASSPDPKGFLWIHDSYKVAAEVLSLENVTLMALDEEFAYFCQTDRDVTDPK
jgi:hypothetical protein